MKEWLESLIQEQENNLKDEKQEIMDCSVFPARGEIVADGDKIVLTVVKETENYINVSYEYSAIKGMYKDEGFRDMTWEDFLSEKSFVCSIYDKTTSEYAGYCSIKDLQKKDLEMEIELKPEFCNQGYGTEALSLLMKEIYNLTGRRFTGICVGISV